MIHQEGMMTMRLMMMMMMMMTMIMMMMKMMMMMMTGRAGVEKKLQPCHPDSKFRTRNWPSRPDHDYDDDD